MCDTQPAPHHAMGAGMPGFQRWMRLCGPTQFLQRTLPCFLRFILFYWCALLWRHKKRVCVAISQPISVSTRFWWKIWPETFQCTPGDLVSIDVSKIRYNIADCDDAKDEGNCSTAVRQRRFHATLNWSAILCFALHSGSMLSLIMMAAALVILRKMKLIKKIELSDNRHGRGGLGFDSRAAQIRQSVGTAAVSSELCCSSAKLQRWIPPLVARFGVIPRVWWSFDLNFFRCRKR